jgi:hypothetical protein
MADVDAPSASARETEGGPHRRTASHRPYPKEIFDIIKHDTVGFNEIEVLERNSTIWKPTQHTVADMDRDSFLCATDRDLAARDDAVS